MKKILAMFILFVFLTQCETKKKVGSERFDDKALEQINSVFTKMHEGGVDTNQPLLYGYFYFDKDPAKLETVKEHLVNEGYTFVRLEPVDDTQFILHVEKIEVHTPKTLLEREIYLDELAYKYDIELFDGWDVGNPDPTKPLVTHPPVETK